MWRFVQVSDPHLGSTRDGKWNNGFLCSMMPDVMRCLKRDLARLKPEFILATGDLASQQTRDATFAARDLMDSLSFPYFPMGGNHDFVVQDSREWFLEAFHAQLPIKRTWYSFDYKNLHFIVLDAWWMWSDDTLHDVSEKTVAKMQHKHLKGARWALPPEQLAWLDEDLSANRDRPTIISCHYPAIPIPARRRRAGMEDAGHLENGADIVALMKRHPQVKAYISGHVHLHFVEVVEGVTHIATGALPEYPTEIREYLVHDDRIEMRTIGLSDTSFAARSLIPGNEWTSGEERDRQITIALA